MTLVTSITREEIIKLGKMSQIKIQEHEIDELVKQLESVLSYASRVIEIAGKSNSVKMPKNFNITREDIARSSCPDSILGQAPQVEGNYFVVPAIIKQQE